MLGTLSALHVETLFIVHKNKRHSLTHLLVVWAISIRAESRMQEINPTCDGTPFHPAKEFGCMRLDAVQSVHLFASVHLSRLKHLFARQHCICWSKRQSTHEICSNVYSCMRHPLYDYTIVLLNIAKQLFLHSFKHKTAKPPSLRSASTPVCYSQNCGKNNGNKDDRFCCDDIRSLRTCAGRG